MLHLRLSHRHVQLSSSSTSSLFGLSHTRSIRTTVAPKRLRDKVNSPGIDISQFALKSKNTARRVKVNRLLFGIDKYLADSKWKDAWDYLYQRMELPAMADSQTRFDAYEHTVTLFSSYERFNEAKEIQSTMVNEGFIPSLSLRTRMASIAVLTRGAEEGDLLPLLQKPLADPNFTELALYQLLRFLGDTIGFSPSSIDSIVQTWMKDHGQILGRRTVSYLIRFHISRGQLEDAKVWLRRNINQGTPDAAPFTDLMTGFIRREHTDELTATIANMQKAGIAPDLAVFNTIIHGHIKRLHFKDAIATYSLLFRSRSKELTPDRYTYTNMFNMWINALKPRYQVWSMRRVRLPHPRQLFKNLIECHLIRTGGQRTHQSKALTTGVLNVALRVFMETQDYPAAYNLLRTFGACEVPANSATVRTVLLPLLVKIRRARRKGSKNNTWLRTILGSGWYENIEANGTLFSLTGTDILERLWVVGSAGPQLDLDPKYSSLSFHANEEARSALTGKTERLSSRNIITLRRIVSRSFFAGAHRMELDPSIPTARVWREGCVKAKDDMLPDMDAMREYFESGKAGAELQKLAMGGGDKRDRHELRYLGGG